MYTLNWLFYVFIFQVEASLRVANFSKQYQLLAKEFDRSGFSADTNRKLESLLYIGDAALDDEAKLEEVNIFNASQSFFLFILCNEYVDRALVSAFFSFSILM